jgi:hypothetical protein
VRLPFRIHIERQVAVHLYVELGFQHGRLADLVQILAESGVTITDLQPDRDARTVYRSDVSCRESQAKE